MSITINITAETVLDLHRDLRQLLAGAAPAVIAAASELQDTAQAADKPKSARVKVQPATQTITTGGDPSIDDVVAAANAKAEQQRAEAAQLAAARAAEDAAALERDAEILAQSRTEAPKVDTGAAIDYEKDIKPLVLKLADAKGRAGVLGVLDAFGVDNASKVPAEKHAALRDALIAGLTS